MLCHLVCRLQQHLATLLSDHPVRAPGGIVIIEALPERADQMVQTSL